MDSLIPGLPNDVAKLCIARVPSKRHALLRTVSKSWQAWLSAGHSGELASLRRGAGLAGDQLYLLVCKSVYSEYENSFANWLWNGQRFAIFSYSLARADLNSDGQVKVERIGEHFSCKIRFPYARAYETLIALDDRVYLFQVGRCVWRCDTTTGLWKEVAPRNWYEKKFAWGIIDGQLYVAGGQCSSAGGASLSAEVYNMEKDEWSKLPQMPQLRGKCQGYVTEDEKFLVFGTDGRGNIEPAALIYDPESATSGWSITENFWPHGGRLVASVVEGRQLFVLSEHGRGEYALRQYNGKDWRSLDCWGIGRNADERDSLLVLDGGLLSLGRLGSASWLLPPALASGSGLSGLISPDIQGSVTEGEEIIVATVAAAKV